MVAMKYLVVVEKSENGFGAYVPDLPGCVAAAVSREEVVKLIQESIEFHIEGLRESGEPVPQPTSQSELVDVHAA
jgi:predicted RNase H-like HicB family nuclease